MGLLTRMIAAKATVAGLALGIGIGLAAILAMKAVEKREDAQ